MSEFGLNKVDPSEPENCSEDCHVFEGSEVGTKCVCGEETVTEQDLQTMNRSPLGVLMAAHLCMPIVMN